MEAVVLVAITMLSPVIGGALATLGLISGRKNWKVYIFCLSLFFANLSYCYIPENSQPDLYRYFEYIVGLRGKSFTETIYNFYQGSNLYVFNFFVWLSNVFKDEHLIPMISVFCVYFIAFYVTCYVGVEQNVEWKYVRRYLAIIILVLDWYSITNNVRNIAAFAVIGFAIFRDVYMKKKDVGTIICYIAPVFIHPTAFLFLAVRLIILLIRTDRMRILLIFATIMISPIVDMLYQNITRITGSPIVFFVVSKAHSYLFDTSSSYGLKIQMSTRSLIARILYLSFTALICFMELYLLQSKQGGVLSNKKNGRNQATTFNTYVLIVGLMALACVTMLRPEYWRFAATLIVFGGSIVIPFWNQNANDILHRIINYSLIIIIIGCAYIWMYQITWLDAPQLFTDMMINSPMRFIIKQIINFFGIV